MAKSQKTPQQKAAETRKRNAAKKATRAQTGATGAPKAAPVANGSQSATLPLVALLCGYHARRKSWAAGRVVYVGQLGGRGGTKPAFMITGSRGGDLPWRREDDADLLAEDWVAIDPADGVEVVI